jgi:hypothetical protein
MGRHLLTDRSLGRALVLALAALVVAVGFCLFDGDEGEMVGHASFDLCHGLAIVSVGVTLLMLAHVYLLPIDAPRGARSGAPHRLDPPPKSLLFS